MEATIKALKARANAHNLAVYVDKHTDSFYIADRANRRSRNQYCDRAAADEYSYCGSMAGRLRERRSRRMTLQGRILAVKSVLWYNSSVIRTLF